MGMYTGIRCQVIIKPEYREEFEYLNNELQYEWSESNLEFLRDYGNYSRAAFIPCGALAYMPDEWEDTPNEFDRGFGVETGLWTFQCSLKNYENTIEYFFRHVLSEVAQEVIHLECFYEEWASSQFYELVDGNILRDGKHDNFATT